MKYTAEYQKSLRDIEDMLDGNEMPEADKNELIENSLICLSDQFEEKTLNVAAYIANAELSVTAMKTVESRMVQRRKSLENRVKSLKQYLLSQMFYMGKKSISNDSMSINVRHNPCKVIVEDQDLIPLKYQNRVTIFTVIKSAIAAELKNGKTIEGAHLESSDLGAITQSLTVRQAALDLNVHRNTTFRWRHRFLTWIKQDRPSVLHGITEADETYLLESHKGSRKLSRKPRKRGGSASKRGISDEQVCILIARDR